MGRKKTEQQKLTEFFTDLVSVVDSQVLEIDLRILDKPDGFCFQAFNRRDSADNEIEFLFDSNGKIKRTRVALTLDESRSNVGSFILKAIGSKEMKGALLQAKAKKSKIDKARAVSAKKFVAGIMGTQSRK